MYGLPTKCSRTIESGIRDQRDLEHGWDDLVLVWVHGILGNEIKVGYRTMYVLLAQLWTMNERFFHSWMGFQVSYGWWWSLWLSVVAGSIMSLAGWLVVTQTAFSGAGTSPKLSLVSQTLLDHLNDKKTYQAIRTQTQQTNKSKK
jgi:hypothetical protein